MGFFCNFLFFSSSVSLLFSFSSFTHMFEEDAELRMALWVDGGLENREEDILQHLPKVGHKVSCPEDVAGGFHGEGG